MAGKVNTRFVALLCASLVICTLAMAGMWYFIVRTDPAEDIARGDGLMAEGHYARAAEQYGKAVHKRRSDVDLLLKYAGALSRVEVDDIRRARENVAQLRAAYNNALRLDSDNEPAFRAMMSLLTRIGRDLQDFDAWNEMYKTCEDTLRAAPDFTLARQYRGVAQVHRMAGLDLPEQDRARALEDLRAAGAIDFADADLAFSLVRWHILESQHLARKGAPREAVFAQRSLALQQSRQLLEHDPGDPQRMLMHYRILLATGGDADALFDRLTRSLRNGADDPDAAATVAEQLAMKALRGDDEAAKHAETILADAMKRYTADLRFPTLLGRLLAVTGQADAAKRILFETADTELRATPINFLRDADRRRQALMQYADIVLASAHGDNRDKALRDARAIADRMHGQYGQIAAVDLLRGKIDLAKGDYAQAMVKLDRASALMDDNHPEALLFSAVARTRMGEIGAAVDRLERLVEIRRDYMPARHELMRLHLRLGKLDALRNQINAARAIDPNDPQTRRYDALLRAREGDLGGAIATFADLGLDDDPMLAVTAAQLYRQAGRDAEARKLLERSYMANPAEPRLLVHLLAVTQSEDDAAHYLALARDAGMESDLVKLLAERDEDRLAAVEKLIDMEQDPFERHYKRYRLAAAFGDRAQADAELSEVAKLKPDDPTVIAARFARALANQDWQVAEQLARKAGAADLDLARGQFFEGRLLLARGRVTEAVRTLDAALRRRPVYSDGWTWLAEAQLAAGDPIAAEASYRRALVQNPAHGPALRGLAMALAAQGKHDLALQGLRDAAQRGVSDPQFVRFYLAFEQDHGDAQRALTLRRQRAEANPNDYDNRRAIALTLARLGQFDDARAAVTQVETDEGVTLASRAIAAGIEAMAGDTQRGVDLLKTYVHNLGNDGGAEPWLALAAFLAEVGDSGAAAAAYRQAAERDDSTDALRAYGDFLFASGEFTPAAKVYGQLRRAEPNDQRIALRHVETLLRADQVGAAEQALAQTREAFGPSAGASTLAALIAVNRGDMNAALESLSEAVRLEPQRAMLYFERARLAASVDPMRDAILDDLHRALELDADFTAARAMLTEVLLLRGQRDQAVSQMVTALQANPRDRATRMRLARLYLREGQTLSLSALLAESEKLFPQDADWPHLRARLAAEQNRHDEAIAALQRAFAIENTPVILADWAGQLIAANRAGEAVALLKQQRAMLDRTPWLWAVAGRALAASGQDDAARAAFGRAIQSAQQVTDVYAAASQMDLAYDPQRAESLLGSLDAGNARVWVQMAIAMRESRRGADADAASRLRALQPQDEVEFNRLLAMTLQQSGDAAAAKAVYERILQSHPDHAGALNNLAYLLAEDMDQPAEAVSLAQRAARLQPGNAQVLDTLGWAQHRAGDTAAAQRTLTQSVAIDALASNCYHLAVVLDARGEQARAMELLEQAARLAEDLPDQPLRRAISEAMRQSRLH